MLDTLTPSPNLGYVTKTAPIHTQAIGLMPSADAADYLAVNRRTLTRWVEDGTIAAAVKLPGLRGAYLFDPAEVYRLASERTSA